MKKPLFTLLFAMLLAALGFSQDGIVKTIYAKDSIITFRVFDTKIKKIDASKSKETIKELIQAGNNDDLVLQQSRTDELGYTHYFYQQFYKGIKVEDGMYIAHTKNGLVESVNGDFFKVGTVDVNAKLNESEALAKALDAIGAQTYKWQIDGEELLIKKVKNDKNATNYPKGEVVIFYSLSTKSYRLAYKFDIYANFPLSHNNVFVDAITGDVLGKQNLIFDINTTGSAATRYSSTQVITTDSYQGGYHLHELTNSVIMETKNMRNQGANYSTAPLFSDNDNNWTAAEYHANLDDAALDAHWGAERVYAYWNTVRGINSWNGSGAPLLNYVHADLHSINPLFTNNDNAFWDGTRMTYGDGTTVFNPVVSLDVIAHEIGHAFCTGVKIIRNYTSNILSSGNEALALNEGMSDIWSASVEQWAAPTKQTWTVGEEIMKNGFSCLRSLRHPETEGYRIGYSTEGNYPDTYGQTPWYSGTDANTFSHTNATVLGHWFYLLSHGDSGTNDLGNAYNVSGIGITEAASIAWRAELYYFTATTNFSNARDAIIQAATDLFTSNSCEVLNTTNAFYAVGVGGQFQYTNVNVSGPTLVCSSGATFTVNNVPSGCTVTWNSSSNITLPSNRNVNPIIATANGTGTGWVQATINSTTCGSATVPQYPVWVGNPGAPTVYPSGIPTLTMGIYSPLDVSILTSPGANLGDAFWSSSGSISTDWSEGQTGRFYSNTPGTGYFFATTFNSCGNGPMYQGEVWVDEDIMYKINLDIDFNLSPNPATDYVDIKLTNNIEKAYSVQFIDSYSRIIKDALLTGTQNRINIQALMKGKYLIRLLYEKKSITKILIVQ